MPETGVGPVDRRLSKWKTVLVCGVAGAVSALGHAPASLPAVSLAGLTIGLLFIGQSRDARAAAWRGWVFATAYFLITLHWIVEPFLVDVARHGWMAPFALLFLSGGLALFWALAAWLGARLFPESGWQRFVGIAILLFLGEVARSIVFTGFPWAQHGYIWINSPIVALAAIFGVFGLTLATLVTAAFAAVAVAPAIIPRKRVLASGAVAALLAGGWFAGQSMRQATDTTDIEDLPLIRIVQPNAAQHLKWRSDQIPIFWQRKLSLTAMPADRPLQLVVWPEVTLPYLLETQPAASADVVAAAQGVPVVVGARRFDGPELRNAIAVLEPDGGIGAIYDKQHLVPFGEFFPGGRLAARLGFAGLATSALGGFTPGQGERMLDLREFGLGRALPLICYEAIFSRNGMSDGQRPDWILQSTNDAWFGNFAGPQQHLDHARMRAIEQGLPLVRAANTGISALIDPHGKVVVDIPLNEEGFVDVSLPKPLPATLFSQTGSLPVFVLAVVFLVGVRLLAPRKLD